MFLSYLFPGPLGNSELEILTRHLERTYGDLHEMSQRFEQVVQHKKDIEEQLETTASDLERSKEKVDFLKKKVCSL
jgi:chromosome segregation ATPase